MNKKELLKNLISDIQDIYSITNRFEQTEQIHPLDIDLSLSKVRNLYELLLKLKEQDSYRVENQKEEISTSVKQQKQTKEQPKVVKPAKEPETKPEPKDKNTEEVLDEEPKKEPEFIIEIRQEKEDEEIVKNTPNEQEEDSDIKHEASPEIVADKFHSKKYVHDDIAKKNMKKDVSSKMQSKPIPDINSAIGLNDKFIFIRELFHNNKDQYHETIQILNNFDTFENAVEYLNENFNWDNEDPNFERLKELVRRKFATK